MQLWIFFIPGSGGDSIANLFEQAQDFHSLDEHPKGEWRIHRYVNQQPKFWAPMIDSEDIGAFRYKHDKVPFDSKTNQLSNRYLKCVKTRSDIVCTSHDVYFHHYYQSDCLEIIEKDQIKILLEFCDPKTLMEISAMKCLHQVEYYSINPNHVPREKYDFFINPDKFKIDWDYASGIFKDLNVVLDKSIYNEWQDVVFGRKIVPGVEHFQMSIDDQGYRTYTKIPEPLL